jgi:hypothetical protein
MQGRRTVVSAVLILLAATAALASGGSAATATTTSGFTTTARHAASTSTVQTAITSVRVSRHTDFDRITFTVDGAQPGYDVEYRTRITSDPTGAPVALQGKAFLRVMLRPTSTVTPAPQPNVTPGYTTLKHLKGVGDFEALTTYAVGVSRRAPFRVQRLSAPNRLVVDLAGPPTLPRTGNRETLPLALTGLTLLVGGLALHHGGRPGGAIALHLAGAHRVRSGRRVLPPEMDPCPLCTGPASGGADAVRAGAPFIKTRPWQ